MHDDLCRALVRLDQEAREAGRDDLAEHVQGCWQILESLCRAVDEARHGRGEAAAPD
jgi:hypothetical protein